jgi:transcriptional regulator with XRE-family HTH domain
MGPQTLAEWLQARVGRGPGKLTQRQVADGSNLSEGYISQLVTGKRDGREEETRKRLAQAFGIPYEQLQAELQGRPARRQQSPSPVEVAIKKDPDLTASQKRLLLDSYYELRRWR